MNLLSQRSRDAVVSIPPGPLSGQRADIQGLRAVAVVSVVLLHLTGHPVGGFVGVDVFFVISGYLITGHLLRDLPKTRSVGQYVGDFYRRRVRRLMPASLLVLLFTVVASRLMTAPSRYVPAQHDALWAAAFWANWHFAAIGTDYFAVDRPTSPLQHYWSLSVEEQFYFVWPVLLFLAVRVVARRAPTRATAVASVLALLLAVASFGFALPQSQGNATAAYYSTFTRAWELGLGALVAASAPTVLVPRRFTALMSYSGLALIGVAVFTTRGGTGFPAPGALLGCFGTAVALAAHRSGRQTRNPLLTNRPMVFLGDASYSIYLVHFPIIILLQTRITHPDGYFYATALALTAGISVLLYRLVEQPVLRSRWLLSSTDRRPLDDPTDARRRARRTHDVISRRQSVVAGAIACLVGMATLAAWPGEQARYRDEYKRVQLAHDRGTQPGSEQARQPPRVAALQAEIRAAVLAKRYPSLQPTMDEVIAGPQATAQFVACSRTDLLPVASCTWGEPDARHLIYLTGDSTAMVYAEVLAAVVEHTPGWRLRVAPAYGCRFSDAQYASDLLGPGVCAAHNDAVVAEIQQLRPDAVVVSNVYSPGALLGHTEPLTPEQAADFERAELAKVSSAVGKIVLFAPPPGVDLATCYHPGAAPIGCVHRPSHQFRKMALATRALAVSDHETYVDTYPWFCDETSGYCPPFVGHVPVMHDAVHASPAYMAKIWPVVKEALVDQEVIAPRGGRPSGA